MESEMTQNQSATLAKFAPAFVKAQAAIKYAAKDKNNPHFKSSYADLASVMEACREALTANEIAVIQRGAPAGDGKLGLETILLHSSGEWISGTGEVALGRGDGPQAYGSAITYARRYFLAAMVGVCPDDDDGEAAEGRGGQRQSAQPPRQSKPAPSPTTDPEAAEREAALAEAWAGEIVDALKARDGFDDKAVARAAQAICRKYKVRRLRDVPQELWNETFDAVQGGQLDKYATAAPAAA